MQPPLLPALGADARHAHRHRPDAPGVAVMVPITQYYPDPSPAIAESFRLAGQGQRVSVGREDGTWYVRILGPVEVRQ